MSIAVTWLEEERGVTTTRIIGKACIRGKGRVLRRLVWNLTGYGRGTIERRWVEYFGGDGWRTLETTSEDLRSDEYTG